MATLMLMAQRSAERINFFLDPSSDLKRPPFRRFRTFADVPIEYRIRRGRKLFWCEEEAELDDEGDAGDEEAEEGAWKKGRESTESLDTSTTRRFPSAFQKDEIIRKNAEQWAKETALLGGDFDWTKQKPPKPNFHVSIVESDDSMNASRLANASVQLQSTPKLKSANRLPRLPIDLSAVASNTSKSASFNESERRESVPNRGDGTFTVEPTVPAVQEKPDDVVVAIIEKEKVEMTTEPVEKATFRRPSTARTSLKRLSVAPSPRGPQSKTPRASMAESEEKSIDFEVLSEQSSCIDTTGDVTMESPARTAATSAANLPFSRGVSARASMPLTLKTPPANKFRLSERLQRSAERLSQPAMRGECPRHATASKKATVKEQLAGPATPGKYRRSTLYEISTKYKSPSSCETSHNDSAFVRPSFPAPRKSTVASAAQAGALKKSKELFATTTCPTTPEHRPDLEKVILDRSLVSGPAARPTLLVEKSNTANRLEFVDTEPKTPEVHPNMARVILERSLQSGPPPKERKKEEKEEKIITLESLLEEWTSEINHDEEETLVSAAHNLSLQEDHCNGSSYDDWTPETPVLNNKNSNFLGLNNSWLTTETPGGPGFEETGGESLTALTIDWDETTREERSRDRERNIVVDAYHEDDNEEDDDDEVEEDELSTTTLSSHFGDSMQRCRSENMVLAPPKIKHGEPSDDGLRRSTRNRIAPLRQWLGEKPVYVESPSGRGQTLVGVQTVDIKDKRMKKYRTADPIEVLEREREEKKRRLVLRQKRKAQKVKELNARHRRGMDLDVTIDSIVTSDSDS